MTELKKGEGKAFSLLVLAGLVTFFLPAIPFGNYILWPFVILTTYIHEMGHGLMAILWGGNFVKLEIFSNASGLAYHSGVRSGVPHAMVAAAGLLGPSIAGGLFILAGRTARGSSRAFLGLSIFMLLGTAIWVRTFYGGLMIGGMGILFLMISRKGEPGFHQFLIQFLGVQMLADTLTRTMDYLFVGSVHVGGRISHSDTGTVAANLGGPYWMWGTIIAAMCLLIFFISLRKAYFR
jgi:hypothetical protein